MAPCACRLQVSDLVTPTPRQAAYLLEFEVVLDLLLGVAVAQTTGATSAQQLPGLSRESDLGLAGCWGVWLEFGVEGWA